MPVRGLRYFLLCVFFVERVPDNPQNCSLCKSGVMTIENDEKTTNRFLVVSVHAD